MAQQYINNINNKINTHICDENNNDNSHNSKKQDDMKSLTMIMLIKLIRGRTDASITVSFDVTEMITMTS